LSAEDVKDIRVLLRQLPEFAVADFSNIAFDFGSHPGTAFLLSPRLLKQPQLAKKIPGVEVGNDHLSSVIIFDQDSDRTLDDKKQRVGTIARADDVLLGGVAATLAMHQEFVEVLDLGRGSNGNHGCVPENCAVCWFDFLWMRIAFAKSWQYASDWAPA
jgi:hypothetical protein